MSERHIYSGMQLFFENQWVNNHAVVVEGEKIKAIIPDTMIKHHLPAKHHEFSAAHRMIPGLIDLHVHGANNHDVMDGTPIAMQGLSEALAREGVTGFLATTMTASTDTLNRVLPVIDAAATTLTGAALLGIHLEGPFISAEKAGAQCALDVQVPDETVFNEWQVRSGNRIRVVTLAPECTNAIHFIKTLRKNNVIASLGHTDATYDQTMEAIRAGASVATHLFNAMRGMHQREPGAAGALLLSDAVTAELIVDGFHLHPAMVELALRVKGTKRLVLVSDAMRAKCMKDGVYTLGGQAVTVDKGRATLSDGTLAGSTLRLIDAVRRLSETTNATLAEAITMATLVPACLLQCETRKGSIDVGKDADLTVINANFEVVTTVCEGRISFSLDA